MLLIIGLGNPGDEFKKTRHNIGRETAQVLQEKMDFPEFRFEKKWNALVSEGKIDKEKIIISLPNTFMNKSGNAVAPILRFFKVKPKDIYVIHDDADLELGAAKLSFGKHSAGHKGVESVMRSLKTRDFWRFRIGIAGRKDAPAEKLVLKKFTPKELLTAKKIIRRTVEAIMSLAKNGPERTMNTYNQ